jgi:hypothetical protein
MVFASVAGSGHRKQAISMTQLPDLSEKPSSDPLESEQESDFPIPSDESARKARGDRLRQAVRDAGGATLISQKSRVSLSTLHAYQGGQEMKLSQVVSLADACGVSVEWLATGRGSREKSAPLGFGEPIIGIGHNGPPDAPEIVAKWPRLHASDARIISGALSLAHTSVYNKEHPVDAGLFISALNEFYGAFTRPDLDDAARAIEIGRISDKYRRMSEKAYAEAQEDKKGKAPDV